MKKQANRNWKLLLATVIPAIILFSVPALYFSAYAVEVSGKAAAPAAGRSSNSGPEEPRAGKYNIYSYGAPGQPPLYLGHFVLEEDGSYRVSNTSSENYYGEGEYDFDEDTNTIEWLSGPFNKDDYTGVFTVERGGKTHQIRLRRNVIGTNSTDY